MWPNLIILTLLSTSAWGYKLTQDFINGFYWPSLPISINVVEKEPSRKKFLEKLSLAAIDDWQTSSGLNLWNFLEAGSTNIIRWSTDFANETNMDPKTVLAVAIRYTEGPYFARAEIVINGEHEYNQNESYLRTTLTHELGHTMGLDHSEIQDAVMAPSLQPWYTGLHSDDLEGIHKAYTEMDERQLTNYVSPLSYREEESKSRPLSCGTLTPMTSGNHPSFGGILSLVSGILISFIKRIFSWFKSRL